MKLAAIKVDSVVGDMMKVQSSFSTSASTVGTTLSLGPNLATGIPSLLIRNLVKFHLMALIRKPGWVVFRKAKRGWAPEPLTSTFSMKCQEAPYFSLAQLSTSWAVPGSCPPNWLHGKARIARPLDAARSCSSTSCLYELSVRPHFDATLTTRMTFPLKASRLTEAPWLSFASKW